MSKHNDASWSWFSVSIKLDFENHSSHRIFSKPRFVFLLQFSMCRNYSKAIQELKSVSLMKITTSIPLGIKLKDYKVSLQIGDVLVRDRVNVRQDVQLLMIGWKALKESIIMPLHFVKAQWYFLVRIFSFNKVRF